jgi:hypothetical protein
MKKNIILSIGLSIPLLGLSLLAQAAAPSTYTISIKNGGMKAFYPESANGETFVKLQLFFLGKGKVHCSPIACQQITGDFNYKLQNPIGYNETEQVRVTSGNPYPSLIVNNLSFSSDVQKNTDPSDPSHPWVVYGAIYMYRVDPPAKNISFVLGSGANYEGVEKEVCKEKGDCEGGPYKK